VQAKEGEFARVREQVVLQPDRHLEDRLALRAHAVLRVAVFVELGPMLQSLTNFRRKIGRKNNVFTQNTALFVKIFMTLVLKKNAIVFKKRHWF
jgi:hypothetical protein